MPPRVTRRQLLLALFAGFASKTALVWSQDTPGVATADLKDQLEKGLRARLPREFAFIGRVIYMVDHKELPLDLVKSTFDWAREKAKTKRYPFPYFEQAMRIRAKRIGIVI
jgi:hypothetical protein